MSFFSNPPILNICSPKCQGLVLGSIGLIGTKGMDVGQPIWQSGCPTKGHFSAKITKMSFLAVTRTFSRQGINEFH